MRRVEIYRKSNIVGKQCEFLTMPQNYHLDAVIENLGDVSSNSNCYLMEAVQSDMHTLITVLLFCC